MIVSLQLLSASQALYWGGDMPCAKYSPFPGTPPAQGRVRRKRWKGRPAWYVAPITRILLVVIYAYSIVATVNLVPGESVYGEKRISVENTAKNDDGTPTTKVEYRVWVGAYGIATSRFQPG